MFTAVPAPPILPLLLDVYNSRIQSETEANLGLAHTPISRMQNAGTMQNTQHARSELCTQIVLPQHSAGAQKQQKKKQQPLSTTHKFNLKLKYKLATCA